MVQRTHVNGKYMADHVGADVVLEGTITKLSSDARNVELTTFDGIKVNVALNEPFAQESDGIMQVFGKVQARATLSADSYVCFPPEAFDNVEFDPTNHNDLMDVLHVMNSLNVMEKTDLIVNDPVEAVNEHDIPDNEY